MVLVDEDDAELLDFALAAGKLTVGIRSYTVRESVEQGEEQPPTAGVTWTDFTGWFITQRISATMPLTVTAEGVAQSQPEVTSSEVMTGTGE